MYEKGQRLVIRDQKYGDQMVIVEDIIADEQGQKLKVKDPVTHLIRVVDPFQQTVVEHLED
jgi:hypothetical protein